MNRKLLLAGNILWISGTVIIAIFIAFIVVTGGMGLLILSNPIGLLPVLAILAIAVGRYLVTKAKA